jgi:sugar phosphate isomerase/epimerase
MGSLAAMDQSDAGAVVPGAGRNGRPRLLAATGPLLLTPLGWVLDAIADAGFTAAEIMFAHNPESRDPEQVLRYAEEAGLEIPVVHGPYLVLLRTVLGAGYVDKSRRSLELAAEIGAGVMVAHAPFRWERRALAWLATEADDEAAGQGTKLAMENLFPVAGRAFSAAITPAELGAYRHIVFDTSHFAVSGIDLFEAWDALQARVVHLHVSDNFGNGRDSHAPLGTGTLPLEAFVTHVCRSGYLGTITLELDCRAYLDSRRNLVAFLERERVKAEHMLARAGAGGEIPDEGAT